MKDEILTDLETMTARAWAPIRQQCSVTGPKRHLVHYNGSKAFCGRPIDACKTVVHALFEATCLSCWQAWAYQHHLHPCYCGSGLWIGEEYNGNTVCAECACKTCDGTGTCQGCGGSGRRRPRDAA